MIKLSIITPAYNCESTLKKCLDSIPTREDIEIIIVNDCSTDGTSTIIGNYINNSKNNIQYGVNPSNMGCGYSKAEAYKRANGEYLITLDSDDYLILPGFETALNYLYTEEANNYDLIYIANRVNKGDIGMGSDRKATGSYFVKKDYLFSKGLNYPNMRRAGDFHLMQCISKYKPRIKKLNILTYHYNYPREGSIVWNHDHGVK